MPGARGLASVKRPTLTPGTSRLVRTRGSRGRGEFPDRRCQAWTCRPQPSPPGSLTGLGGQWPRSRRARGGSDVQALDGPAQDSRSRGQRRRRAGRAPPAARRSPRVACPPVALAPDALDVVRREPDRKKFSAPASLPISTVGAGRASRWQGFGGRAPGEGRWGAVVSPPVIMNSCCRAEASFLAVESASEVAGDELRVLDVEVRTTRPAVACDLRVP